MTVRLNFFSHHKCATRWFLTYLERVTSLNGRSLFHTDFADELRDPAADIAFFGNATYRLVADQDLSGLHIIRNPLNIIVSSYYSHRATHPTDGWPQLAPQRALLQSISKDEGMFLTLTFIEREDIADRAIGPLLALRGWDYDDARYETVRMEDVVAQPEAVLRPALCTLREGARVQLPTDDEMAFANFAGGRTVGMIDNTSHYRSGSFDDWKSELPLPVVRYVRQRFADVLARFYPEVLSQGFYEFDESTRIDMTNAAIRARRTLLARWQALGETEGSGWNARAAQAAELLKDEHTVADLGCGTMSLEKYLPDEAVYLPVDVVRRDRRTVIADFNVAPLPVLSADAFACLGLLEYLFDVPTFLMALQGSARVLVVSYNPRDLHGPDLNRRAHAWVNDYDRDEIEAEFRMAGWGINTVVPCGPNQLIWRLEA